MIKNERQYQITKSQLKAFEESLKNVTEHLLADSTSELAKVHRDALESQREQFLSDIGEYERLRSGEVSQFVVNNINEVPQVLIKARIALGLTQKELANRLEVKEQQVQTLGSRKLLECDNEHFEAGDIGSWSGNPWRIICSNRKTNDERAAKKTFRYGAYQRIAATTHFAAQLIIGLRK